MLKAMRGIVGSWIIKAMMILLVLSFALWGMGDIFRSRGATETVASVGSSTLSPEQLRAQVDRYIQQFLKNPNVGINDTPQVRNSIALTSLQGWVSQKLFEEEASRLGITVPDEVLKRRIAQDSTFQDPTTKQFSPEIFKNLLYSNNLSEQQYLNLLRQDLVNSQLAWAFGNSIYLPMVMQELAFKQANEKRVAEIIDVPYAKYNAFSKLIGKEIKTPDDATLKKFQEENASKYPAYTFPEYRKLTVLTLSPESAAKEIKISDDDLRAEYDKRKEEFSSAEKREVKQAVFTDEAQAQNAAKMLKSGKNFAEATKSAGLGKVEVIDLGLVERQALPDELADAVFTMKSGAYSDAIKSPLGWHIVQIGKVKPAETKSFAEVKPQLQENLRHERAVDEVYKLTNGLQDKLASGKTFEELAKTMPVTVQSGIVTDKSGLTPQMSPIKLPAMVAKSRDDLLTVAFNTDKGKQGGLAETKDGGFYVVRVDEVTPTQPKPFASVKGEVLKDWQNQDREQTGFLITQKLVEEINKGKTIADISKQYGLATALSQPTGRDNKGFLQRELLTPLFSYKKGETFVQATRTGIAVASVKDVIPSPEKYDPAQHLYVRENLGRELSGDIAAEFQNALRDTFNVKINEKALETLY